MKTKIDKCHGCNCRKHNTCKYYLTISFNYNKINEKECIDKNFNRYIENKERKVYYG